MDIQDLTAEISASLSILNAKRVGLTERLSTMLNERYLALEPISKLMEKYQLPFRNDCFFGKTFKGFVLGESRLQGDQRHLYVYNGLYVCEIDAETDKRIGEKTIEMDEFLKFANLKHIKAGFDYVADLKNTAIKHYASDNKELKKFLDEFK